MYTKNVKHVLKKCRHVFENKRKNKEGKPKITLIKPVDTNTHTKPGQNRHKTDRRSPKLSVYWFLKLPEPTLLAGPSERMMYARPLWDIALVISSCSQVNSWTI